MILELVGVSPALSKVVVPPWKRPRTPASFRVLVACDSGVLHFECREGETTQSLMASIYRMTGTSTTRMVLMFGDRALGRDVSLIAQGVADGCKVELLVRSSGLT